MMRVKCILVAIVLLFIANKGIAQYKGLKIGDDLPDFLIPKILFDAKGRANTNMFKDRLLIIDFWATNCSGCVAALPKMETLQKQFGDKVKILPVTYEKEAFVSSFWKANKYTKGLSLPTVIEDLQLKAYFPHQAIPHEIWINKGKVIGITESEYVDAFNIEQVLNGKIPDWPFKNDFYAFNGTKEMLFNPDKNQMNISTTELEYAAISEYKEKDGASAAGVFGAEGTIRDSLKKTIRTYFINQPIFIAYSMNWAKIIRPDKLIKPSFTLDPNQVVWEVKDPLLYMFKSPSTPDFKAGYNGDWIRKNAICFESFKPDHGQSNKDIAKDVIADLDRLLGLKVRWEKRKEKVLVLVKDKEKSSKLSGTKEAKTSSQGKEGANSIASLLYHLNQEAGNPYVFKESGLTEVPLTITPLSWKNIDALRLELKLYGLDLKEEERIVDKFIFSEVDGSLLVSVENKQN